MSDFMERAEGHFDRVLKERDEARAEADRLRAALTKINAIRNSIVGLQNINWSEHIYPLVAALNEAGMPGLNYPEAKANVGTLLERANRAEAALVLAKPFVEMADRDCARGAASARDALEAALTSITAKDPSNG